MIPVKFKSLDSVDVLYDEMIKNISKKNAAIMDKFVFIWGFSLSACGGFHP